MRYYPGYLYPVAVLVVTLAFLLGGCAATTTALSHSELETQTKMSSSIFLDPVPSSQKTAYVQFKNTSDKQGMREIREMITKQLQERGYKVVDNLDEAHYLLQANVRQATETSPAAVEEALGAGYGGAVIGAAAGGAASGSASGAAYGGLAGAAAATAANAMVENVTYAVITDLQLSKRTEAAVDTTTQSRLKQGSRSVRRQRQERETHWRRYQTRVIATANQANLEFKEAAPKLKANLAHSIAGLL